MALREVGDLFEEEVDMYIEVFSYSIPINLRLRSPRKYPPKRLIFRRIPINRRGIDKVTAGNGHSDEDGVLRISSHGDVRMTGR